MGYIKHALKYALCLSGLIYLGLAGLSFAVFHLPWPVLELLPEAKRDQLISLGVVSPAVHPLYRDWLQNFVRLPNAPRDCDYVMDSYRAYGQSLHTRVDDEDSDFLGFANAISPSQAEVLFVGDSFANGASVGTRLSPPAVFAKLSGKKVYNASNGGYGIAQYVRIIDKLTGDLPEGQRFIGKDVVVLVYLGNDFTADMVAYNSRLEHTDNALLWQLKLGPLYTWAKYVKDLHSPRPAPAAPSQLYYPVHLACPTSDGLPFAWHPGFASFLDKGIFQEHLPLLRKLLAKLKELETRGLSIKIVFIPASIQVLRNDIVWSEVSPQSRLAKDVPGIVQALDEIELSAREIFHESGFEVLDLTETLRSSPQRCSYFQPADSHCTAKGYALIGQAVAEKWPNLGNQR